MYFNDKDTFKRTLSDKVQIRYGRDLGQVSPREIYPVLAGMVRDEIGRLHYDQEVKARNGDMQVYYFSMEFLTGRMLGMNLRNLGLYQTVKEGLADLELGMDLEDLTEEELEPGLGNGGLGRLAACYLDAMTATGIKACACGIGYQYGLFKQKFVDGYQVELPEDWLRTGCVWQTRQLGDSVEVHFYGQVDVDAKNGDLLFYHHDYETVRAIPYDLYYVSKEAGRVNTLKVWAAELFDEDINYASLPQRNIRTEIVRRKREVEEISSFLYPDDSRMEGRRLRLKQQYFLSSAGVQTLVKDYRKRGLSWQDFSSHVAIHINDTHPVLVIPELMRLLLDEEGLGWEEAWTITCASVSYTNHTILPEALETWPLDLLRELLPRIAMIIEEINSRAFRSCRESGVLDNEGLSRTAVIREDTVYMANLALATAYKVNGVAQLHTKILTEKVMADFYKVYPEKFVNVTNGINHRRWLLQANPGLAALIDGAIGPDYRSDFSRLADLRPLAEDGSFRQDFDRVRRDNKAKLADYIARTQQIMVDPDSIFDVQIKRLHGYKRQLMNLLHIVYLYQRLLEDPQADIYPRTFIFGAKAAPGYLFSKDVIKLINTVAQVINRDERIGGRLKLVFMENYSVSLAEKIIPASDLSQQISTASKEASGTGNMKLMLNGALTLGTLDGANIEIRDLVGEDNIFIFGMTASEVMNHAHQNTYDVVQAVRRHPKMRLVLDAVESGLFAAAQPIIHNVKNMVMMENDQYFVVEDFEPYQAAQERVQAAYKDRDRWLRMSILNVAGAGFFSGDRAIGQYMQRIWGSERG